MIHNQYFYQTVSLILITYSLHAETSWESKIIPKVSKSIEERFRSILPETPETNEIAALLKVYQAYDSQGPIQLRRIGRAYDGGYVIPELVMEKADIVIGYGIADDISFEEEASRIYKKPSYGFDGTCDPVQTKHELCHFIPQCIASNAFLLQFPAKRKSHSSFKQHLEMIGASEKKIFIKMDIEGYEYDALPTILEYASNITGIVLEIHFQQAAQVPQSLSLMSLLSKDFLLVHVHGNNYSEGCFITKNSLGQLPRILELTYINKNLLSSYEISKNQTHPTLMDMPNKASEPDSTFTILGGTK